MGAPFPEMASCDHTGALKFGLLEVDEWRAGFAEGAGPHIFVAVCQGANLKICTKDRIEGQTQYWIVLLACLLGLMAFVSPAPAKPAAGRPAAAGPAPAASAPADEFENVRCGDDIPKALIGQRSVNGPVEATEKKYRTLSLKDLGGDEISDRLSSVTWSICGAEYILLIERGGIIRDALAFPAHSRISPAFSGKCQFQGKDLPGLYVAVLDALKQADPLPVRFAWKIDQSHVKFVQVPIEGIACPRSGISTADGGP
jgi:hypothetical protein